MADIRLRGDDDKMTELTNSIKQLITTIEKQNVKTDSETVDVIKKRTVKYYLKRYIQEIIEASFGLYAVTLITRREIVLNEFIKIVSIIGVVTLILEEYNLEYSNNFKQGIHFTLGSSMFGS